MAAKKGKFEPYKKGAGKKKHEAGESAKTKAAERKKYGKS